MTEKSLNETYKEILNQKEETISEEFYEIRDQISIYTIAVAIRRDGDKDDDGVDAFSKIKLGIYRGLDTAPIYIQPKDVKVKLIDTDGYDGRWEEMGN